VANTNLTGVGERYATALFDLADEAGQIQAVENDLRALKRMHAESQDLRRLLENPGFTAEDRGRALGAVAEPYLHAFPRPDDFIPLLLTGKLTLAEVYWRTTPLTSWKISMVGDPLYTPFKNAPALRVEDLPEALRGTVR